MKTIRRKKPRSFTYLCVTNFIFCSLVTALVIAGMSWLVDARLSTASPKLFDVLEYEDALREDDFSSLPLNTFKDCSLLILDENLNPLYYTDSDFAKSLEKEDIQFINDYYTDENYWLHTYTGEDGQDYIIVEQMEFRKDKRLSHLSRYCVLDNDFNIVDGDLFAGVTRLTERQYALLLGTYQNKDRFIERHNYTTNDGKARTLIFLEMEYSNGRYEKKVRSARQLWLLVIPLFALMILIQSLLFVRNIRNAVEPLNAAILAYRNGERVNAWENGLPTEFHGIVENFDQMLDQLEDSNQKIQQTNEDKQRILTNLSHDLKTPIAVIQGYAQALRDGVVPAEKTEQYLRVICDRADAMSELVSSLLKYTTMEHSNYVLSTVRTDFCEFCRQYLSAKYEEIQLAGFQLELDIPETPLCLLMDYTLIRRAFDNLFGNVLKYNPPGTVITFRLSAKKNFAELIFADNGVGIPKDILYQAFDPLVSGDKARTSGTSSGIGLTIVRTVAELHGGTVYLVIPPEEGFSTEFCIRLPLAAQRDPSICGRQLPQRGPDAERV